LQHSHTYTLELEIFSIVNSQNLQSNELKRLLQEQSKTRHEEVFGGMSAGEKGEYARKEKRINELEIELVVKAKKRSFKGSSRATGKTKGEN
jgi:hypothetical protein